MDYHLAPDVHACRTGDLIIFLDIRNDRYFASPLAAVELNSLSRSVRAIGRKGLSWTAKLVAQGLVQDEAPAPAPSPKIGAGLTLPRSMAFAAALLWAGRVVDQPFALRRGLKTLSRFGAPHDRVKAITESALFASWRPLWPRAFVCLHDTLALARFLSVRGAGCDIVFGVQGRPFAAHCWAECEGAVLNDEAEYCASFDVILRT